jgi:hypothetical protein
MNRDVEGVSYARNWSWPYLRCYTCICLEGLRESTENLSQDSGHRDEIRSQEVPNKKQVR